MAGRQTEIAHDIFSNGQTDGDRAANLYFDENKTNDPRLEAAMEVAKATRDIAWGLKHLSMAMRDIYDLLEDKKIAAAANT